MTDSFADRYRAAAAGFSRRVHGTTDWDAPTPVAEWRARDIVDHLATWLPAMVGGGSSIEFTPGPSAQDDPIGAWQHLDSQVQALLDDPATAELQHTNPHTGTAPVPQVIDQYFTSDVVLHTWDLARATGQDDRLDEDFVEGAYAGMTQMADMIRGSGQFGEQQTVPNDATTQDKLFAFLGRDPRWAPPA